MTDIYRDTEQTEHERGYVEGQRAAWRAQLQTALGNLRAFGADEDPAVKVGRLALQLDGARAALREVCAEFGDNDWSDSLDLRDVIEKHLVRHLRSER